MRRALSRTLDTARPTTTPMISITATPARCDNLALAARVA
jgi:hypothetical protein